MVGQSSSHPEAFVAGCNANLVRRFVPCAAAGQLNEDRGRDTQKPLEITNELKSEVLTLQDPQELRDVMRNAKKVLFKWRLDDITRKTSPDIEIKQKAEWQVKTAASLLRKMEEDAKVVEEEPVLTYTQWMTKYCDLESYKRSFSKPRNRKSHMGERLFTRDMHFKQQFQQREGWRYDKDVVWKPTMGGGESQRDRYGDGQLSYEEFIAKGGKTWWKGQQKLRTEAKLAYQREKMAAHKADHASWKPKWAKEAEVRRKELGQTE